MAHIRKSRGRTSFRLVDSRPQQDSGAFHHSALQFSGSALLQGVLFHAFKMAIRFQVPHPNTAMSRSPKDCLFRSLIQDQGNFSQEPPADLPLCLRRESYAFPQTNHWKEQDGNYQGRPKKTNPLDLRYSHLYLMGRSRPLNRSDEWVSDVSIRTGQVIQQK